MAAGGGRQRGFTLLEVIVALALMTLLVSVVYGGFSTAVRAYEAGGVRTDAAARMRVTSDFLRRSVGGAFPLAIAGDKDWRLVFEGGREEVRFVADLPTWVGIGGLHEIVIGARREDGREALLMRRRPLVLDADGALEGDFEDHVLLEEVSALRLRYFGSEDAKVAPSWRDEWPPGRSMPALVELRVTDGDGGVWPPILVHPRVDTVRYQSVAAPGTAPGAAPAPAAGAGPAPAGVAPPGLQQDGDAPRPNR